MDWRGKRIQWKDWCKQEAVIKKKTVEKWYEHEGGGEGTPSRVEGERRGGREGKGGGEDQREKERELWRLNIQVWLPIDCH